MSENASPHFWWVNQGTTYAKAREIGFIWAPKVNRRGRRVYHWENVSRVRKNDFLFNYARGELRAISIAKSDGYEARKALGGSEWADDGWRVDADYYALAKPLPIRQVGPRLADLHMQKGPVDKTGGANQGYLFALTPEAARMLVEQMQDDLALQKSGILEALAPNGPAALGLEVVGTTLLRDLEAAAVRARSDLVIRFTAALLAKRFVILTGLAGSGKTKLAQAFVRWLTPDSSETEDGDRGDGTRPNPHYALVPVGADWTGNENIVGYPDGLNATNYVTRPTLELIRHALEPANARVPHFLILDEMNLSHVERYFADLLSAIESGEAIPLYEGGERKAGEKPVPRKLALPDNVFIIGTVNVDETTYMFSPKVLDRANVIEFRMEPAEMKTFLGSPEAPRLQDLDGKGTAFAERFVWAAAEKKCGVPASVKVDFEDEMLLFFDLLRQHGAEFGYRTAHEAARFMHFYKLLGGYSDGDTSWFAAAMDAVIVQKFLPKLHGSRSTLEGLLWALAWACAAERVDQGGQSFADQLAEAGRAEDQGTYHPNSLWHKLKTNNAEEPTKAARYPLSYDKVMRMWRKLVRDQFVSFAEA